MPKKSEIVETRTLHMVFPADSNHYGTLFGGKISSMMDLAAFITASRFARKNMVVSSQKLDFRAPVKHGQLAELIGRVVASGKTSVTVEVKMFGEDLLSGKRQLAAQGKFVLVAIDKKGSPLPIAAS